MKRRRRMASRQDEEVRGLAAINRARNEGAEYLTPAVAEAEGTTLAFLRRRFPKAFFLSRHSGRLRVRPTDPYSWLVEILGESGPQIVTAHGSHERELAGRHRAACLSVLANRKPGSILRRFRNKTVGGARLLSDPQRLFKLARGGEIEDLGALYVSPGPSN
jgi:hypothetical protein